MSKKKKCRFRWWAPKSGKANEGDSLKAAYIVRYNSLPVNHRFACTFLCEVFAMLSQPVAVDQIAKETESTTDRVKLALHDLQNCGVQIGREEHER